MLNQETKKRIFDARDILVGKIPDPKAQVEQITTALIYKFMDDMDRESEELGGEPQFFAGNYTKYGWRNLVDPRLGGHDRLNLYAEALETMPQNPELPQLFRNILKDAFLPYRDPETLRLFLKTINEFTYEHSEKLGDAFEYLLSILGSQGDAGQFRTPRHIIDFIVAVLDPKKNETILDPACGTAGFLISSYKHILQKNSINAPGDQLTPDEKTKLMKRFVGYDISPDMVRLSLVNMYLHGFPNPTIYEYDTLTSEDRWDETADIIMANPPFMTPKGGIRPHKRFSVQAKRSEILFVDYIAEHLNPDGRAGIIVPEGVVFQSGNAYKDLRKMLVEKYIYAVVSLPAGVFNPYSGVKTSILFMDKNLAKKAKGVLFVKIEHDGFDLGAQRKPIDKNSLPFALLALQIYKESLENGEEFIRPARNSDASRILTFATKSKIAKAGDYSLVGEWYRESKLHGTPRWPIVDLGKVALIIPGQSPEGQYYNEEGAGLPFYQGKADFAEVYIKDPTKWTSQVTKEAIKNDILMSVRAPVGPVNLSPFKICIGRGLAAIRPDEQKLNHMFLFYLLRFMQEEIKKYANGSTFEAINREQISAIQILLPPRDIQQGIVAELDSYQRVIDGARQVVESYKPQIKIDPSWKIVKLDEVCEIKRGRFSYRPRNAPHLYGGQYPFLQTGDIAKANGGKVKFSQTLNEDGLATSKLFKPVIVLVTIAANIGDTAILDYEACFPDSVVGLIPKEGVNPYYLQLVVQTKKELLNLLAPQAAQKNINVEILKALEISLPPLEIQEQIVFQIEEEKKLVASNERLIELFEQKIKDRISDVWGNGDPTEESQIASEEDDVEEELVEVAAPKVEQATLFSSF